MASTGIPDWLVAVATAVAALGTVGTLIAALWQINTERKARQRLERQAEQRERHAQAERISAWVASRAPASALEQSVDDEVGRTRISLLNRSEEPVYRAVASLVIIQLGGGLPGLGTTGKETSAEYQATLDVIPPGQHYIDVAEFFPVMLSRPGVELAFTDCAGVHWRRSANGDLTEIDKAPVDHYGLGPPQGWTTPIPDGR